MTILLFLMLSAALLLGASTVSAAVTISIACTETLSTSESPLIDTGDNTLKEKIAVSKTMTSASSPDAELHAAMQVAMTAGAVTIDFTSLARHGGASVSFSGKLLRAIMLRNPSTNANDITIVEGASNGLAAFGASFSITLKPGWSIALDLDDDGPTVGSSDRTIDVTGTGSQVLDLIAVAG